jgi:hypothetical protein
LLIVKLKDIVRCLGEGFQEPLLHQIVGGVYLLLAHPQVIEACPFKLLSVLEESLVPLLADLHDDLVYSGKNIRDAHIPGEKDTQVVVLQIAKHLFHHRHILQFSSL